jgi:hypothetical protein
LLSYFGPARPSWRRILVIGQEPDTDQRMGTHAGPYDLPLGRHTSFWILSHKAIGRASEFGEWLRDAAIECGSSPIVYSDASPASHAVGRDALPRPSVTDGELKQHAHDLLALPDALACPVVIISGRKPQFAVFYGLAEEGFRSAGAVIVDVPFFGFARGSTADALVKPLRAVDVQPLIHDCVAEWAAANGLTFPAVEQDR